MNEQNQVKNGNGVGVAVLCLSCNEWALSQQALSTWRRMAFLVQRRMPVK